MKNIIEIDSHEAFVTFDTEIGLLRGEFLELAGGADFYAETAEKLVDEGRISLRVYFDACREYRIAPVYNPAFD